MLLDLTFVVAFASATGLLGVGSLIVRSLTSNVLVPGVQYLLPSNELVLLTRVTQEHGRNTLCAYKVLAGGHHYEILYADAQRTFRPAHEVAARLRFQGKIRRAFRAIPRQILGASDEIRGLFPAPRKHYDDSTHGSA